MLIFIEQALSNADPEENMLLSEVEMFLETPLLCPAIDEMLEMVCTADL